MLKQECSVSILLLILLIATYYDLKDHRIPNALTFPSMALGLFLCMDIKEAMIRFACCLLIFLVGMTGIMGMGDLKLFMVMNCFLSFLPSVFSLGMGAVFLIFYITMKDPEKTFRFIKLLIGQIRYKDVHRIETEGYPFAPFLALGTVFVLMIRR